MLFLLLFVTFILISSFCYFIYLLLLPISILGGIIGQYILGDYFIINKLLYSIIPIPIIINSFTLLVVNVVTFGIGGLLLDRNINPINGEYIIELYY